MNGNGFRAAMTRADKFQLAGGTLMFAPRYPLWLETPGFWDDIWWHDEAIGSACTWSLIGADRRELPTTCRERRWRPGISETVFDAGKNLRISETKYLTEDNTAVCLLRIENGGTETITTDLVFWSRQTHEEQGTQLASIEGSESGISFQRTATGRRGPFTTAWRYHADRPAHSWAVYSSERFGGPPRWRDTPFASGWRGALLPGISINPEFPWGALWPALHYRLRLPAGGAETISLRLHIDVPGRNPITIDAPAETHRDLHETAWDNFFADAPSFACATPLWEHLWRYRWYLLRQNLKRGGDTKQPYPGVCEGSEIFHQPISYSTPAIVFDLRWHRDPSYARNTLKNFAAAQEPDGRLPGALHHDRFRPEFFYHADWGRAFDRLLETHPDESFRRDLYTALARYGEWLGSARDPEGSGLIDIVNHMETGQEFNTRYLPANPAFDGEGWDREFRLKGVDSSVYAFFLWRALANSAAALGFSADQTRWSAAAARTAAAIFGRMWQPASHNFNDLLPPDFLPTGIQTLTNFYPFLMEDIAAELLAGLARLTDPAQFWTPFPATTLSREERFYDDDARWKGKTRSCTWNGRVWPMTNSHIVEVLARASELDPAWLPHAAHLFSSFVRLFDAEGDGFSLSSWEHYHPLDGSPCRYRGIDDYLHCWVIDLIVRFAVGFQTRGEEIVIDPWPLDLGDFALDGLPWRGEVYGIHREGTLIRLLRNGRTLSAGPAPLHFGGGR